MSGKEDFFFFLIQLKLLLYPSNKLSKTRVWKILLYFFFFYIYISCWHTPSKIESIFANPFYLFIFPIACRKLVMHAKECTNLQKSLPWREKYEMQTWLPFNDKIFEITFGFGILLPWCFTHASYIPQVTCYIVLIDRTFSESIKLDIQSGGSPELNVC